jgi:hypothetical protein
MTTYPRDSHIANIDAAFAPAVLALDGAVTAVRFGLDAGILRTIDSNSLENIDSELITAYVGEAVSRLCQFKTQADGRKGK